MTQRTRNLLSATVLLVAGVAWFVIARDYRQLSKLYPQVIASVTIVFAIVLGVLTAAGHGPVIRLARGDAAERHLRSGTLIAALVGWTLLIPLLGLLVSSIIGVLAMGILTFRSHIGTKRAVFIAVAVVLVFYFLFQQLLNVYFPMGLFG